ncbi:MAG: hypothetical protein KBT02_01720 [Treponema sp.]|nr:hypothetical protein [Candidatus Treponema caballi]
MKKSFLFLLLLAAFITGLTSCAQNKHKELIDKITAISGSGTPHNIIVMVAPGLTDERITQADQKNMMLPFLPVHAASHNPDEADMAVMAYELAGKPDPLGEYAQTEAFKVTGYATNGDTAHPYVASFFVPGFDELAPNKIYEKEFTSEMNYSPVFLAGKGDFDSFFAETGNLHLNEVYKAQRVKTTTLSEAAAVIGNEDILFTHSGHEDKHGAATKLYCIFDDATPAFNELAQVALQWIKSKDEMDDGFFLVLTDTELDQKDELASFDDAVAVASSFVAESQDTLLLVIGPETRTVFAAGAGSSAFTGHDMSLSDISDTLLNFLQ